MKHVRKFLALTLVLVLALGIVGCAAPAAPDTSDAQAPAEQTTDESKPIKLTLWSCNDMIRPNELQTQYLPDSRWGDTVPVTLQTLLVRGFSLYDVWTHVGRVPLGTAGDYAIISEINDFNAEVSGDGAIVKMTVDAQMVREADATVVSRGHFVTSSTAASTKTADLVPAFDAAGQQLVAQMTAWGLKAVGVNAERCR